MYDLGNFIEYIIATLPFLIQASYQVNEHLSSKIIELISMALIGKQTDPNKEKKEKFKSKVTKGKS